MMKNSHIKYSFKKPKNVILQLLQDYRFNSILVKNFVIIFIVLVCAFTGIMLLVSNEMNSIIEKEVGTMSINSLSKTKESMDTVMNEVVQISGQLSLDNDVGLFLLPGSEDMLNTNQALTAKKKIKMYSGIFNYIDSIYIYSNKSKYIVTSEGGGSIEDFLDLTWYPNLTEREYEPARMISRLKEDNYPYLISYIQPVRLTQMQFLGGIIVNIDVEKLDELVNPNASNNHERLLIVDDRDNIIFSSDYDQIMKKVTKLDFYKGIDDAMETGYQIIHDAGQDFVLTKVPSENFKWDYISLVPLSTYQEYQDGFQDFYIMLVLFIFLISGIGAVFISLYSYTPVKSILSLLKNPDLYESDFAADNGLRKDETHEIALNIIRNLYSNQQMRDELGNYLSIINKAQITALQAQISPHFLYNTLENIRWMAIDVCKGDNEVSQIILNLSEMLRVSLDNEHQIITIKEEINNTKLYIEILQLRYKDKLSVEWEIDENTLSLPIVKVSLQPIIENAIYHGIKPLREGGIIKIKVSKTEEEVIIQVSDNGLGMSKEEVDSLNDDLREKYVLKEGHIGVRNVNQRLKLLLGDTAQIKVRSELNRGTIVTVSLPLSMKEQ